MAELLIDVDRLLTKIGELDATLSETIEKSTKDAASKGFLAASLQIKNLTEVLEFKIQEATLNAHSFSMPNPVTERFLGKSRQDSRLQFLMGFLGAVVGVCMVELLGFIGR